MADDKYDVVVLARYANSEPGIPPIDRCRGWRDENSVSTAEGRGWDENTLYYVWDSRDPHWW